MLRFSNLGEVISREELKLIIGGVVDPNDMAAGTCGVNFYDHWGNKIDEIRGVSKASAQSYVSWWNPHHDSVCDPNCGAVAKWCCESC